MVSALVDDAMGIATQASQLRRNPEVLPARLRIFAPDRRLAVTTTASKGTVVNSRSATAVQSVYSRSEK